MHTGNSYTELPSAYDHLWSVFSVLKFYNELHR